jgi:hypothetical protein
MRATPLYEFLLDRATMTGADFLSYNVLRLYLVDGRRGDDDLTANGVIVDPGAPAVNLAPTAVANAYTTNEDTTLEVAAPGLLANDRDGRPLTARL